MHPCEKKKKSQLLRKPALFTDWPLCIFELLPSEFQITGGEFSQPAEKPELLPPKLKTWKARVELQSFHKTAGRNKSLFGPYLCVISCISTKFPNYQCLHMAKVGISRQRDIVRLGVSAVCLLMVHYNTALWSYTGLSYSSSTCYLTYMTHKLTVIHTETFPTVSGKTWVHTLTGHCVQSVHSSVFLHLKILSLVVVSLRYPLPSSRVRWVSSLLGPIKCNMTAACYTSCILYLTPDLHWDTRTAVVFIVGIITQGIKVHAASVSQTWTKIRPGD